MKAKATLLLLMLGAAPAFAQEAPAAAAAGPDDVRVNQLVVYGDDPCPESTNEEITVCARKPDAERFRIPEVLRSDPNDPVNQSWANRATEMQYVGRSGIGSCSTTGPGGMTGCYNDLVRQARAERAGRDSVNWNRLIEEARQERLSRIDSEADAEEAASRPN
ncbi:MAG TPA: hypothetical protein VK472_00230 [Allosphingosinicella sp.]|nr:hypothetical protein [Allosphingosinicella sp.]